MSIQLRIVKRKKLLLMVPVVSPVATASRLSGHILTQSHLHNTAEESAEKTQMKEFVAIREFVQVKFHL